MICAECAEEVEDGQRRCPACSGEPLLAGRLRIDAIEQIDALGTTYRATRVADAAPVWLRELPFRRGGPSDPGSLLDDEARRLATLRHDALPTWIEHFVHREGRMAALWLVQAQVDGTPLARIAREHPLEEPELLARLEQLADLLVYLHDQSPPVVHGGITPSSVIEQDGRLLLVGFNAIGSDREITPASGSGVQSLARSMAGMAPEQFLGRAEPATDIWGLGLIAVVLLTGSSPLDLRDGDHRLIWRDRVAIDASLASLLDAMLDRDVARRPNARALREQIAKLRRSQQATARLPRDEILRASDHPAIAGTIGQRRSPETDVPSTSTPTQTHVLRETKRPIRRTRRSDANDDVPIMRPADLSRELSQAHHATEQLLGRSRRRLTAARMTIVLVVALLTAGVVWLALFG